MAVEVNMDDSTRYHMGIRTRLYLGLIVLVTAIVVIVTASPLRAQGGEPDPVSSSLVQSERSVGNAVDGFPVELDGEVLFWVKEGVAGVVSAQERAKIVQERIEAIAGDAAIPLDAIRVEDQEDASVIYAGDMVLFTVRDNDAKAYNRSRADLAADAVVIIQKAVREYRESRNVRNLGLSTLATVFSTIALAVFLRSLFFVASKLLIRVKEARQAQTLRLQVQTIQILGANATAYLLESLIPLVRLALVLVALYLYVPFVLSQFPATKSLGNSLLKDIAYRVDLLVEAFVAYLPSLAMIAIIIFATYYLIGFSKRVIAELGREDVYPWFYPEWVQPTIRLVIFLMMAIALVIAAPFLPGFGSPAFQGVSLFLGALLTLGSSSAVANAVAGIILIYTRAFQLGDFIRFGDIIGEVQEKSLFVTRILTPKRETVTIPNSAVLNSNIVNYTAICREEHSYLLLHTTITLGYDAPWRKIHDALIEAAKATLYLESDPSPFVLQTALNDYNVSYQINAYTNHPELMPQIYSALHQNIQDYCNQAGIEILSPAYASLRDGNHSTIPADYLPKDYCSPSFQVRNQDGDP